VQLLVSVANAREARRAVDGGADIIDAKDPLSGALGAVSLAALRQIHSAVAGRRMVTAALGDASDDASIEQLAFEYGRTGVAFVKIGFAGITDISCVERLLLAAVRGTRETEQRCGVVAVAYADTGGITSVDPTALIDITARAGAAGVLLDTAVKEGPGLRHLMTQRALETWVTSAHRARLTVALAGRLALDDLSCVADTGADIAGVRGAACEHSRTSGIVEERVRLLCAELTATTAR
jgi:(5-formylfuran-3-yl)methyl phosphate synthase